MISRILIVGLGSAGSRHLRLARLNFPNSEIKVLCHRTQRVNPEFSDGCFLELEDAIQFDPDIAIVANPSTFHIHIAKQFALTKTHLFIEKPLSSSVKGVHELIEICKENDLVLMVGYNLRFSPSLQFFRQILSQGIVGELLSVRCEVGQYLPSWRPEGDYRLGVTARKELGGGALLELSHEIDYLRWIFGEFDWVRATLSRQSKLEIDVEDSTHLTIGFLSTIKGRQLVGTLNLDLIRHDRTRVCTVIGEKGTLRWNGFTGEVSWFESKASDWLQLYCHEPKKDESYDAEWKDFMDSIQKKKVPFVTGNDGLKVLEFIEAARSSAITGAQVRIHHSRDTNSSSQ